jgi:hypothetical protein
VVFTVLNGTVAGAIALAEIIRSESRQTIAVLKEMNIPCMMLTGDNKQVAKWVSEQVGQRNLLISKLFRVFLSMIFGLTRLDGWMHLIWNLTAETRFLFQNSSEHFRFTVKAGSATGFDRTRRGNLGYPASIVTTHPKNVFAMVEWPFITPKHPR